MTVRWDNASVGGNAMRVYAAVPSSDGPHPAVVVIHHGAGVDGFTQDVVNRLWREGYAAVAPDLFHRQPERLPEGKRRIDLLKDSEIIADVNATVSYLRNAGAGKVGIVGFCMGGRVVYLAAGASKDFSAGACFYGGNIFKPWGGDGPTPFDRTKSVACPIIGFFGKDDPNPTPADVDKISKELTKHGKEHRFYSYTGAGHAFQNFLADSYRERAAKDSWGKMLRFFEEKLKAREMAGVR
ncbi:MAG: dienelactone hydrolase family protein [SAR202 cluster bacterium]|nr:dienelactone hydrolase family protein [SAR202 cluster bacterium]